MDMNTITAWLGVLAMAFVIIERAVKIRDTWQKGKTSSEMGDMDYAKGLKAIADGAVTDYQKALLLMDSQKVDYDQKLATQKSGFEKQFAEQRAHYDLIIADLNTKIARILDRDIELKVILGRDGQVKSANAWLTSSDIMN